MMIVSPLSVPKTDRFTFCHAKLSMKFIMLINDKMPTIVGILTFISMMNTTSESLKARKVYFTAFLVFYKQVKFHALLG